MTASAAKIEANRRNASKSTGPRTLAGKSRSRANAIKHGLCATTIVLETPELLQQRADDWYYALKPQNPHQSWLVHEVALASLRIDRAERSERRLRDRHRLRAELAWDIDRATEAEALGARISRRPAEVADKLRRTPQGCDWLIGRWRELEQLAGKNGSWTADQARLAFDLLGTPLELREGRKPGERVDVDGRPSGAAEPAEVARREILALRERRELVADLDEVDRCLTAADLLDESNAELKRTRRYEATLHNRLRWYLEQIQYQSPHQRVDPDFKPRWVDPPAPAARPDPASDPMPALIPAPAPAPIASHSISPPFDLEPDEFPEPGQVADIPAILASRMRKKLAKAESRRESRRRKLERLRA